MSRWQPIFRCSGLMQGVNAWRQHGQQAGDAQNQQTQKTLAPILLNAWLTDVGRASFVFASRFSCGFVERKLSAPNASMNKEKQRASTVSTLP